MTYILPDNLFQSYPTLNHEILVRIGLLEAMSNEISDYLPHGLQIQINNIIRTFPPTNKARTHPINCTKLFIRNPIHLNQKMTISWIPDGKIYVLALCSVQKVSSDILMQKLQNKKVKSIEETKDDIIKMFADNDNDPDLVSTSYYCSLVCPLGKTRINIPAKSINCKHLQSFDALTFILMNEKNSKWICPVCDKQCEYDDLQIDSYFLEIVNSTTLTEYNNEIEVFCDGSWKVKDDPKKLISVECTTSDTENNSIEDCIMISDDSDDETFTHAENEVKPEYCKKTGTSSNFVDLTNEDDE